MTSLLFTCSEDSYRTPNKMREPDRCFSCRRRRKAFDDEILLRRIGKFPDPPKSEHRAGIVSGIAIPDSDEAEIFRRFDAFVGALPARPSKTASQRGGCWTTAARSSRHMIVDLPGILICPIMLDLTSLVGQSQADVAGLVSQKLMELQAACKHQTLSRPTRRTGE